MESCGRPCGWRIARAGWKPWRSPPNTIACLSLVEDQAVLVRGLVLPEENSPPKISIQDIVPLAVARVNLPTLISIRVGVGLNGNRGQGQRAKSAFRPQAGRTEVRLRLEKPRDFSVILDVAPKVRPDKEFWAEVERICGPESVEVLAS